MLDMRYRKLDIYRVAFDLFLRSHKESFKLPKHETYEIGSQLRRSAGSVTANIVEGYGRSNYKQEHICFLIFSHAIISEKLNHIAGIIHLYPDINEDFKTLYKKYDVFGSRTISYTQYVKSNWNKNPI